MSQGHEVRCLVRRKSNIGALQQLGVDLWVSDTFDEATLRQATRDCDYVYHLAGKTSACHRHELYAVNAIGTARVARACAAQMTPPVLILVSSLAAAGTSSANRPQTEEDRARPVSWYGRSKRAGEVAAVKWSRHVPLSIVRPGIVFGPANRELLPVFQSIARWGIHVIPGHTPRRVSLIHHEDLLEILTCVAQRGRRVSPFDTTTAEAEYTRRQGRNPTECFRTQGRVASVGRSISCQESNSSTVSSAGQPHGIYFAADPEQPTYLHFGRMIARALEKPSLLVIHFPEPFAWLTALGNQLIHFAQGRSDSFNVDKIREALAGDWTASVLRLEDEFGFRPRQPLQARLNETAGWYRAHGWIP